jgi:hypothetical protein
MRFTQRTAKDSGLMECDSATYDSQQSAAARKPDTQPSAPHYTDNLKTKHQIRQAETTCIILSSS